MSNHILFVGAPGVGKDYIVQHVTGSTEPITWITTTNSTTSPTNNTYPWNIQNKYYSATLSWHIVTATATATDTATDTDTISSTTLPPLTESNIESLCPPQQHQSVQALVLVYDPINIQTWEAVESWHHYISRYNPSILLVVANHITSTSTSTPIPSAALAWCSEYGCEHIIMPHGNTLTTSTTKSLSASESDHDMGCTRIVDAMHANMWNIMTRKEVTMNHGMDSVEEDEDEDEDEEEEDVPNVDVDRDEKTHDISDDIPDVIPKTIVDEEKQKRDADTIKKPKNARKNQRKREKKKEKSATAAATTTTVTPSTSTSTTATSSSFTSTSTSTSSLPDPTAFDVMTESDLERSLESFSAMFDRVRGIREQASSGTMSDEMRRKQAANAIMSMLQGLGIEDEADEDSENEIEPNRQPAGPEPLSKVTSDK